MSKNKQQDTLHVEDDDPYANIAQESANTLETEGKKESARSKKWNKLKQNFGMKKQAIKQGFLMGSMVGGGFGLIMGIYAGIQYRSLVVVPLTALGSAASFGFFMACGTLIRSHQFDDNVQLDFVRYNVKEEKYEQGVPLWKVKYMNTYI